MTLRPFMPLLELIEKGEVPRDFFQDLPRCLVDKTSEITLKHIVRGSSTIESGNYCSKRH